MENTVKKRPIINDIAQKLNISITTVSFILNGKAKERRISDSVTEKVLKLVDELGYKPNQLAKSLRTGKTNIIGLIVEDIANPFFANIARLIEENAYKEGYKILYCSTENNTTKTKELISMFRDRHVDGYIITPPVGIEEEIQELINAKLPVILFDRYLPDLFTNYVVVDNFGGTYMATNHLNQQGFQDIAFITIESGQTQMENRQMGYEKAIQKLNKNKYIKKVLFEEDPEITIAQIYSFLKENNQIDAIVFGTNYLGVRGLEAIKRLGLKIPADIGVVSFDDHDLFRLHTPSITAIAQPIEDISKQVIKILLGQLTSSEKSKKDHAIILPANLILRESSIKQ